MVFKENLPQLQMGQRVDFHCPTVEKSFPNIFCIFVDSFGCREKSILLQELLLGNIKIHGYVKLYWLKEILVDIAFIGQQFISVKNSLLSRFRTKLGLFRWSPFVVAQMQQSSYIYRWTLDWKGGKEENKQNIITDLYPNSHSVTTIRLTDDSTLYWSYVPRQIHSTKSQQPVVHWTQ